MRLSRASQASIDREVHELKLPIVGRDQDLQSGLAFDLLTSKHGEVFTGHQSGVITLDLSESDDAHREQLRIAMAEPYRTLLGHLRRGSATATSTASSGRRPRTPSASSNSSAIPMPTINRPWTPTPTAVHQAAGNMTTSPPATMHPAEGSAPGGGAGTAIATPSWTTPAESGATGTGADLDGEESDSPTELSKTVTVGAAQADRTEFSANAERPSSRRVVCCHADEPLFRV